MKYYITFMEEIENLYSNKALLSAGKEDTLIIFCESNQSTMPIALWELLSQLKCKVEFKKIEETNDEFKYIEPVYLLGQLSVQNMVVEILSKNPYITKAAALGNLNGKTTRKKTVSRKNPVENKENIEVKQLSMDEVVKTEPIKKRTYKKKETKEFMNTPEINDDFDAKYNKLVEILQKSKTKAFDPVSIMPAIVEAVRNSIKENKSFEDAVNTCMPNYAKRVLKALAGKEDEITNLVKTME